MNNDIALSQGFWIWINPVSLAHPKIGIKSKPVMHLVTRDLNIKITAYLISSIFWKKNINIENM